MQGLDFIAIDFETATGRRASVCEAGVCVVRDGRIAETRSWLVRPQGNMTRSSRPSSRKCGPKYPDTSTRCPYSWRTTPRSTWAAYAVRSNCTASRSPTLLITARSAPQGSSTTSAATASTTSATSSRYPTAGTTAPMCARLFLREVKDAGWPELEEMDYCNGKL